MSDEDFLAELDRKSERQTQRVRELLYQEGRPDLVADLDKKLRDIRLGIDGARGCWHALSFPQKEVIRGMVDRGWHLRRSDKSIHRFLAYGDPNGCVISGWHSATVRNLMARELVTWEHGFKVVVTERGRFVRKYGPPIHLDNL